jgi:4-hydroxy-3-methylbut-2-enyl diphosphate reductase
LAELMALRSASTMVVRTGMGRAQSLRSAVKLGDRPRLVAGVAGGLAPGINVGDVVVASQVIGGDRVIRCQFTDFLADRLDLLGLTVHVGQILSTPRLTFGGTARAAVALSGALAVDMESAWLAGSAAFAVVRVISDTATAGLLSPAVVVRGWRALRRLRQCRPALDQWAASLGQRPLRGLE